MPYDLLPRTAAVALLLCFTACAAITTDDPHARTPGVILDDQVVERMARQRILEADEMFRTGNVSVVCFNGIVLLTGQVENSALRGKAAAALDGIRKVRKVHNEILVSGPTNYVARTNDSWISTKVRARLLANATIESDVGVTTEDGVVYLLGRVRREDADVTVAEAQEVFGVRKIVKVFEYVD
ncbi:MAG: BON domain-containing protein [Gammaproteobacteria bacterium]|nr:BON domain-containing protein [Gammaproteobacteria bacterium]